MEAICFLDSLCLTYSTEGFSAIVRSEVIASGMIRESLAAAASILPLASPPVKVLPQDLLARVADYAHGRLIPPPDVYPQPFDVELALPPAEDPHEQADGLFIALSEILRRYRELIAHSPHL